MTVLEGAAVITRALAEAEQCRRDSAATCCADCAAMHEEARRHHLAFLAPASAYRELAAELVHATKSAGRDVPAPRPTSEPLPLPRERSLPMKVTAAAPDPSPKPPTPPARAVQFFRRCGYSPEDAAVMARIAAEARILLAADSQETVTPGRRAMTAPAMQQARSLHEVCEAARLVNCGECWTAPGKPCTPEGDHVARFGRAMRRGLLSGPDLVAVLGQLDAFTTATVVETPGGSL